jgi:hypothetical protein
LAIFKASSKSFAFMTERTGPKTSSLAMRMLGVKLHDTWSEFGRDWLSGDSVN